MTGGNKEHWRAVRAQESAHMMAAYIVKREANKAAWLANFNAQQELGRQQTEQYKIIEQGQNDGRQAG